MRNYSGYNNGGCGNREYNNAGCNNRGHNNRAGKTDKRRTKLVIEDNTIYEIDLDCCRCRCKGNRTPQHEVQCPDRTVPG